MENNPIQDIGKPNQGEKWLSMSEAALHTPYSAEYLSLLARKGKLVAKKIDNAWYTTRAILDSYMQKQMMREQIQNGNFSSPTPASISPEHSDLPKLKAIRSYKDDHDEYHSRLKRENPHHAIETALEKVIDKKLGAKIVMSGRPKVISPAVQSALLHKKTLALIVISILFFTFFPVPFVYSFFEKSFDAVKEALGDASTVMGFRPGTHENEILLLDKEGNIAIGGHIETRGQLMSSAPDGVAPIVVDSTTLIENLNADRLDGLDGAEFTLAFVTKNGNMTTEDVFLSGNVEIGKTLVIKGADKLRAALEVEGELKVFGDAEFKEALRVLGPAEFESIVTMMSDLSVKKNISVRGSLEAGTVVANRAGFSSAGVAGKFSVGGDTSLKSATSTTFFADRLRAVLGIITSLIADDISVGALSVTNSTTTNATTTSLYSSLLVAGQATTTNLYSLIASFGSVNLTQSVNGSTMFSARRITDAAPSGDFIQFKNAADDTTLYRVDNSGNVLAGGIISSGSVTITSVSTPQLRVQYDSTNENTNSVTSAGVTTHAFNGTTPRVIWIPQTNGSTTFQFQDAASNPLMTMNTLNRSVGIGTTTPQWALQIASSTNPQLTLSDPSTLTNNHWSFRNAGGKLYLATSSPSTFATSTTAALTIDSNTNVIAGKAFLAPQNHNAPTYSFSESTNTGMTLDSNVEIRFLRLGSIQFIIASNAVRGHAGSASLPGYSFFNDTTVGLWNPGTNRLGVSTNGIARWEWDASGNYVTSATNVNQGIGTTTPRWALQIASSTAPQLTLSDPSTLTNNHWSFRNAAGTLFIGTSSPTTFATSTTPNLVLTSGGNLGLGGTTSPYARLSIQLLQADAGTAFIIGGSPNTPQAFIVQNDGKVGLGTTSPNAVLDISDKAGGVLPLLVNTGSTDIAKFNCLAGAPGCAIRLTNNGSLRGTMGFEQSTGQNFITAPPANAMVIRSENYLVLTATGNTPAGAVTLSGNFVGIGTTTPDQLLKLHSTNAPAIGFSSASGATNKWTIGVDTNDGHKFKIASSTAVETSTRLTIDGSGNVGIGDATPDALLDVEGTAIITGTTTIQGLNVGKGRNALANNTAFGVGALNAVTTGNENTAIGWGALPVVTSGNYNTAVGLNAGSGLTTGENNTFLGKYTGFGATTGSGNVIVGSLAGYLSLTTGSENILIGESSGVLNGTDSNSIVIGRGTTGLGSNTVVIGNTAVATTALRGNVGIGTTTPHQKLDVHGLVQIHQSAAADSGLFISQGSDSAENPTREWQVKIETDDDFIIKDNISGGDRLTINTSGNVGIGTTTPWGKLSVTNTDSSPSFVVEDSTSPDSTPFLIDATGNVGIGVTNPLSKLTIPDGTTGKIDWNQRGNIVQDASFNFFWSTNGVANAFTILSASGNVGIGGSASGHAYTGKVLTVKSTTATENVVELWASNDSIADETDFFKLEWQAGTASSPNRVARVAAISEGTSENSAHISFLTANAGSLTEKMRIGHDGATTFVGAVSGITTLSTTGTINAGGNISVSVTGAGSTSAFIANRPTSSDYGVVLYRTGGTSKWSVGPRAGSENLLVFDETNSVAALTFTQGTAPSAAFAGAVSGITTLSTSGVLTLSSTGTHVVAGKMQFTATGSGNVDGGITKESTGGLSLRGVAGSLYDFSLTTPAGSALVMANPTGTSNAYFAGNVGIGTTSPTSNLHVYSTGNTAVTADRLLSSSAAQYNLSQGGTTRWALVDRDSGALLGAQTRRFDIFDTIAAAARFSIDNTGKVGIGTSTPSVELEVHGALRTGNSVLFQRTAGSAASYLAFSVRGAAEASNFGNALGNGAVEIQEFGTSGIILGTNGAKPVAFGTSNTERMRIDSSGVVSIGTTVVTSASAGDLVLPNNRFIRGVNTGGTDTAGLIGRNTSDQVRIDPSGNGTVLADIASVGNITSTGLIKTTGTASSTTVIVSNTNANADPSGSMHIGMNGIVFGGTNGTNHGFNSAQIVAGVHVVDTLNIMGMENEIAGGAGDFNTRKVAIFTEGGLRIAGNGNHNIRFDAYTNCSLTTNGSGVLVCSSDERLKNIQGSFDTGLEAVLGINPIVYQWNELAGAANDGGTYTGFSAQNVEQFIPEAITTGINGYRNLNERPILAAVINAIKELNLKISDIEESLASTTITVSTSTPGFVVSVLETMKASIVNGATHFIELAVESLSANALTVGKQEKPSGITFYDEDTGTPYCVKVKSGVVTNTAGKCGELAVALSGGSTTFTPIEIVAPQEIIATSTEPIAPSTPEIIEPEPESLPVPASEEPVAEVTLAEPAPESILEPTP